MTRRRVFIYVLTLALSLLLMPAPEVEANSITRPDSDGDVGSYSALLLDADGNPVVSYYDATNGDLKVLHCTDPNCADGGESITRPDTTGDVGLLSSMRLDADGNPVVSYYDATNGDLKVLHCNDPRCADGDESITSPDTGGDVGFNTSLALDSAGNPVVSYQDKSYGKLKVMHCNDPNCAGGDERITGPDAGVNIGASTSLVLDPAGYPVVSYFDIGTTDLKLLHCNDPNCAGDDESVTSPDTLAIIGTASSLVLDGAGNPVISYYDESNDDLKVLHCNDPDCAGGDESIQSPDSTGTVGFSASIALDAAGYPVVSYHDADNGDLKVLHCNDPNCEGGGESIISASTGGDVGFTTSLVLDGAGNPVVSYYDVTWRDLRLLHCGNATCTTVEGTITTPDSLGYVGQDSSLALDDVGNPVVSYYGYTNGDLKILHCNDPSCTGGNEIISSPDTGGNVGNYSSLALDGAGNPVVSYYDLTNGDLKILHCNDPSCAGGNESITSPDTGGIVGSYTSLVLDAAGYPIVSYFDDTNDDLKVLHCNDAYCAGGDESITSPDTGGHVGEYSSLVLDAAGYPIVSYFDDTNDDLKVLHCNDAYCAGGDESITSPDTPGAVGSDTSLTLDGAGNPVISYFDYTNYDLKLLHCNDANCAGGDESITSPDTGRSVGQSTSLALDGAGNPVVSYLEDIDGKLRVLHCNDPNCAGGGESITSPDADAYIGPSTSLFLDAEGHPVVSYYDVLYGDLKLLHCFRPDCGLNVSPEVNAGVDQTVDEGDVVDFSGSASDENGDELTIAWDFGDGSTAEGTLTPQHVYADDGAYTVTLRATDEGGLASSDTLSVVVGNVAPDVDAGPDATVQVGNPVQFAGSFSDASAADTHEISWDFGDGGTESGSLTPAHVYAAAGQYTVALSVTDDDGGAGTDTLLVTVTTQAVENRMLLPVVLKP